MSHYRRRLLALGALVACFLPLGLALSQLPADAHHAELSGVPSCDADAHSIAWTIGNSVPKQPMTIVVATAMMNGVSYSVDGYTNPVPDAGTTTATSTIPGPLTGTVTLSVTGHWPDGHHTTRSVDVPLTDPCTTTTTTGVPPTTAPPVTSSPPVTNHTTTPSTPPATGDGPPASTCRGVVQADGTCKLAFTGPTILGLTPVQWGLIALALLALGFALLWAPERRKA